MHESNDKPTVVVCLAAFNGRRWLPEQLASILAQTGVTVTVVISVDQSNDGTEAWCDRAATADDHIRILPHGEHFGGASRNFFRLLRDVDLSKFDYISFADQDDIWLPHKLAQAHATLLKANADAYSSNVITFWPDNRQIIINKAQPQVHWDFLFEAAGPGCTYVFKKELACALQLMVKQNWPALQKVGLHDWFFYAFARANGYRWVIDHHAGMLYRQHDNNQVGINAGLPAFMRRARKVIDGWGFRQTALIAQMLGLGEHTFVQRWSTGRRIGFLSLARHARQCRRRPRDQLLFALSCVAFFLKGLPPE